MKIYSSKRDDIIKQRDAYEADRAAKKKKYDEQYQAFDDAQNKIYDNVRSNIEQGLKPFRKLNFVIAVSSSLYGGGMNVSVRCNERELFAEDNALSWNYQVNLDKSGEITKESSSWSGLKATTEAQMESLTQTLEALKYLNSVDWKTLMDVELPKYEDYVTERDPHWDRNKPNFDQMLLEADVEEAMEKGYHIKIDTNWGVQYYKVTKETGSFYYVTKGYQQDNGELKDVTSYRLSKQKFFDAIKKPIETLEG